ncbi:MAG: hypothetical protein GXO97_08515 [Nitrospirae bacterium]|nr:hypothetical protein [Nitrospirota bacterium]
MIVIVITYIVLIILYIKGVMNVFLLCRADSKESIYLREKGYPAPLIYLISFIDVIFFRRLFRINKPLWLGEWLFHISFLFVILAHLRFLLIGLPSWWSHIVCIGKYGGIVMPFSLVYILIVRASIDWRRYISPGNLFLILLLILISLSGLFMRYINRMDIIDVKAFVTGIFTFNLQPLPDSRVFVFHYLLGLVLLLYLPSHVMTAPITVAEARRREEFRI